MRRAIGQLDGVEREGKDASSLLLFFPSLSRHSLSRNKGYGSEGEGEPSLLEYVLDCTLLYLPVVHLP